MFKAWLFNKLYIVLTRPEDIEFILASPKFLKKSTEYRVLQQSIMGQGIFTIEDINKWKINRYPIIMNHIITIIYLRTKMVLTVAQCIRVSRNLIL